MTNSATVNGYSANMQCAALSQEFDSSATSRKPVSLPDRSLTCLCGLILDV